MKLKECDACKRKDGRVPVTVNGKKYCLCFKCTARIMASRSWRNSKNR